MRVPALTTSTTFVPNISLRNIIYSSSYSAEWDEGLCPDVNVLKLLGEESYSDGDDFLPMRASGTVATVAQEATVSCHIQTRTTLQD